MATYHPSDELLMQFAAGQLADALGIMVACHLVACEQCRQHNRRFEQLGAELIDDADSIAVSATLLQQTLAKLESLKPYKASMDENPNLTLPKPLRRFVPAEYERLPWSGFSKNIQQFILPFSNKTLTAKFYKIAAGKELPAHTHRGNEFTLVMKGAFKDSAGVYNSGDFILANEDVHHQPQALAECDCICFAVMDAPIKLTGFWGKFLNPLLR